ncbi:MAG: response regulator [Alphaproteobacteria bacterium]|nr:response regulator [Alphaproteobacteria bacterium]
MRILLVDDEAEVRRVLGEFLKGVGHDVVTAASGREAIELIESSEHFRVAIVDWSMAGISGRDVIEHIYERSPGTLIFVATGHSEAEVSQRHSEIPLDGILRKPFSLRHMIREITAAVDLHQRAGNGGS